jgi:hypothetical protein
MSWLNAALDQLIIWHFLDIKPVGKNQHELKPPSDSEELGKGGDHSSK